MRKSIGIDIGGTNIKIVLLGKTVERSTIIKTPKSKKIFFDATKNVLREFPLRSVGGIGVGIAGLVRSDGRVVMTPNLPFLKGLDLGKFFQQFHKHIVFDNDVNSILRAEKQFGAAKGFRNAVLMAVGTGIGGAILINGKIYKGQGFAGEVGHIILDHQQSFENLAGGKQMHSINKTELRRVAGYVAQGIANLINLLDPQAVILSGTVGVKGLKPFLPDIKRQVKRYVLADGQRNTKILIGQLGELAGAIGAALLVKY